MSHCNLEYFHTHNRSLKADYRDKQKALKEEYSSLKSEEQTMRKLADEKERKGKRYN